MASPSPDSQASPAWWIYQGTGTPLYDVQLVDALPDPPPWRTFMGGPLQPRPPADEGELRRRLGPVQNAYPHSSSANEVNAVNAALYLRRPLLVTGTPGIGKSSLAYRITRELRLGRVLRWPITSRSTLRSGLYEYDPIARVQDLSAQSAARTDGDRDPDDDDPPHTDRNHEIGNYLQLGPLGTALLPHALPRVLLIDELDKGDLDLANDLLNAFEEGEFDIPELVRLRTKAPKVQVHTDDPGRSADVIGGRIRCRAFPMVVITSNGEREFPPAFLRRCLRLELEPAGPQQLSNIVAAHFAEASGPQREELITRFMEYHRQRGGLATDQLLNSIYLASAGANTSQASWEEVLDLLWRRLTESG